MKNYCKLDDYSISVEKGDVIEFLMPPFCSGDYRYTVAKYENSLILDNAPPKIFERCIGYKIIKGGVQ